MNIILQLAIESIWGLFQICRVENAFHSQAKAFTPKAFLYLMVGKAGKDV